MATEVTAVAGKEAGDVTIEDTHIATVESWDSREQVRSLWHKNPSNDCWGLHDSYEDDGYWELSELEFELDRKSSAVPHYKQSDRWSLIYHVDGKHNPLQMYATLEGSDEDAALDWATSLAYQAYQDRSERRARIRRRGASSDWVASFETDDMGYFSRARNRIRWRFHRECFEESLQESAYEFIGHQLRRIPRLLWALTPPGIIILVVWAAFNWMIRDRWPTTGEVSLAGLEQAAGALMIAAVVLCFWLLRFTARAYSEFSKIRDGEVVRSHDGLGLSFVGYRRPEAGTLSGRWHYSNPTYNKKPRWWSTFWRLLWLAIITKGRETEG